jgi:hypothetical protein
MDDIDRALARLAGAPVPAVFDDLEARVLARIRDRAAVQQMGLGVSLATTLAALAIGIVGAEVPVPASPIHSLAPLGGSSSLAPSTLLMGEQ